MIIVAFIWGYSFIYTSQLINSGVSSATLLFARFGIGALVLGVVGFKTVIKSNKREIIAGAIAGICIVFAIFMQQQALLFTSVSKTSFISGASIILVPFFAYFINKSSITSKNIIGLILAVIGTIVLSVDATTFRNINFGDFLAFLSTIGFALQIVLLAKFGKGCKAVSVAFFQTLSVAIGGFIIVLINGASIEVAFTKDNVIPLLYLGVLATAVCYIVQSYASKYIKEVVVSVIISSQALIAMFFDVIILHTPLTSQLLIGAVLISAAVLYLTLDKDNKKNT